MSPVAPRDETPTNPLARWTGLISQLTTFVTALTALATAVAALLSAFAAHEQSNVATGVARQAANATALQTALSTHATPAAAPAGDTFFVQLATYTVKQCEIAKQEIESYHGALTPQPSLWRDPTERYIIIGAATSDRAAAEALQKAAQKLSQDPSQAGNDLANAVIRVAPPFKPLASCPSP